MWKYGKSLFVHMESRESIFEEYTGFREDGVAEELNLPGFGSALLISLPKPFQQISPR